MFDVEAGALTSYFPPPDSSTLTSVRGGEDNIRNNMLAKNKARCKGKSSEIDQ
jgi:hypothetical protein